MSTPVYSVIWFKDISNPLLLVIWVNDTSDPPDFVKAVVVLKAQLPPSSFLSSHGANFICVC